jgi:ABC-2 type transport system permease protein
MLLLVPLVAICSVELNVILSSRLNDTRSAQQAGTLIVLPFAAVYVTSEIGIISLTTDNLLAIGGILALIDIGLSYVCRATFQREEILTRWK